MNSMLPPLPGGIHDEACLRQVVAGVLKELTELSSLI